MAFILNGCSKEDCDCDNNNNNDNWAAAISGTYSGTITYDQNDYPTTILITRIANKQLDFQYAYTDACCSNSFCLDSVIMNSPTTFTINEVDQCSSFGSSGSGGGNFNDTQVNFTSGSHTITGTKQ
ncbi:MAG: hypothetical protein KIS94_05185 [Chitinophagales bacterium]|nr:hypothetical protein [Chitinophagales bacterium]